MSHTRHTVNLQRSEIERIKRRLDKLNGMRTALLRVATMADALACCARDIVEGIDGPDTAVELEAGAQELLVENAEVGREILNAFYDACDLAAMDLVEEVARALEALPARPE